MSELLKTNEIISEDNEYNNNNTNYYLASSHEEMNSRRRNTMEDSHRILSSLSPLYSNIILNTNNNKNIEKENIFHNISFFSIYDGHGGRQIVDFLEKDLEKSLVTELSIEDGASYDEQITRAFLISDMESKKLNHMTSGATGIVAFIRSNPQNLNEKELIVANIGDSRGVLITNTLKHDNHDKNDSISNENLSYLQANDELNQANYNKYILKIKGEEDEDDEEDRESFDSLLSINSDEEEERERKKNPSGYYGYRLSYDHKASDPLEQERIKSLGGFFSKSRLLGLLAVTRSFGDHSMKDYVISRPFISRTSLKMITNREKLIIKDDNNTNNNDENIIREDEDIGIILGCDGIWDVFTDQEACEFVMSKYKKFGPYKDAAKDLVNAAINRGSTDNITAIVIFF